MGFSSTFFFDVLILYVNIFLRICKKKVVQILINLVIKMAKCRSNKKEFLQKEVVASFDVVVFPIIFGSSFIVEFDVFLAAGFEKACLSGKVRV